MENQETESILQKVDVLYDTAINAKDSFVQANKTLDLSVKILGKIHEHSIYLEGQADTQLKRELITKSINEVSMQSTRNEIIAFTGR